MTFNMHARMLLSLAIVLVSLPATAQTPRFGQVPQQQPQGQPPQQFQPGQPQPVQNQPGQLPQTQTGQFQPGQPQAGQPLQQNPNAGVPQPRQQARGAQAPFQLTQQQRAQLDYVLKRWEARSQKIETLDTTFTLFEYNDAFGKQIQRKGEVRYKAPDKGLYRVQYDQEGDVYGEHWVCDGKSIYEFDYNNKRVVERKLPEHLQGRAIVDGPLPFLFSQTAEKLHHRYWMRLITPPNRPSEVWIESFPRFAQDAANFRKVDVILKEHEQELHLFALQVHLPGGQNRKTYRFPDPDPDKRQEYEYVRVNHVNLFDFNRSFYKPKTPFGWKYVVEEAPTNTAQTGSSPQQQTPVRSPQLR